MTRPCLIGVHTQHVPQREERVVSPMGMEKWRWRETGESTREDLDERREKEELDRHREELERDWDERVRRALEWLRDYEWELRKERALERLEEANREFQEQHAQERLAEADWEERVANADEWMREQVEKLCGESLDAGLEGVTKDSAAREKLTHLEGDDSGETSDSAVLRETLAVGDIDSTEIFRGVVEHVRYRDGRVMVELSANIAEILDGERTQEVGGPQETFDERVRDAFANVESGELDKEKLSDGLQKLGEDHLATGEALYFDVRRSLGLTEERLRSFEETFRETREALDTSGEVRFGMVGERLYVWRPDLDPVRLKNAYGDLYYYFRDKDAFESYIANVGESLGLENQDERMVIKHLRELASQMVTEPSVKVCIDTRLGRVRGDYVQLMNDLSGKTLTEIQDEISRLTGREGRGGIEKPLFPQGEELEIVVARIAATVLSDCSVQPNGGISYAESEMSRAERVIENIRNLGDINPSISYNEKENLYRTHFPFVIGKLLMQRGVPSGDRTIQNPRLISSVREGTDLVQRAYVEDFMPQDGCVGQNSMIWHRVNALHAAHKTEKYQFEPRVGDDERVLIKEHGRKERGNAGARALAWGRLDELKSHTDDGTAKVARRLIRAVKSSPNRLIDDEAGIIRSWGIDMPVVPSVVRFYPKTGRVTITWQARTAGLKEAIKLGIVAPPNDIKNRQKVKQMILENPEKSREALGDLRGKNIEFRVWWEGS